MYKGLKKTGGFSSKDILFNMTYLKLGKKQMSAGASSAIHSRSMDESYSLSGDSNGTSECSNEQTHQQSNVPHRKKPVILPNSDIDGLLECPVCSNSMFPPIQQAFISDSSKAHNGSLECETIADTVRDFDAKFSKEVAGLNVTRQIMEEAKPSMESYSIGDFFSAKYSVLQPFEPGKCFQHANESDSMAHSSAAECIQSSRYESEGIRLFQNHVSYANPDSPLALDTGGMSSELIKAATDMLSNMEAQEFQKMLEVAFSLNEKGSISDSVGVGLSLGLRSPEMPPEMVKKVSNRVSRMTPEELQKMLEMTSFLDMNDSFSPRAKSDSNTQRSKFSSESSVTAGSFSIGNSNTGQRDFAGLLSKTRMNQSVSTIATSPTNVQHTISETSKARETSEHEIADARFANAKSKEEGGSLNVLEKYYVAQPVEVGECSRYSNPNPKDPTLHAECLQSLVDNPEAIGLFQHNVLNPELDSLAALGIGGMSMEIVKTATDMLSRLEPEELQKILEVAFSLNEKGPIFDTIGYGSRLNSNFPEMTLEMVKMASDKASMMTLEELKKMLEVGSSLHVNVSFSPRPTSDNSNQRSKISLDSSVAAGSFTMENPKAGESNCGGWLLNSRMEQSLSSRQTSSSDLQMLTSMKNVSPEMMTSMTEQLGLKLSREEVEKAHQVIKSLSADDLNTMMQQQEGGQSSIETAKKIEYWISGRSGLILAVCVLILALIFHKPGFTGR